MFLVDSVRRFSLDLNMGLSRVIHWGPLAALVIIFWVSLATVACNSMYWPPQGSWGAQVNLVAFLMISSSTLYHFMSALLVGPGHVPEGWAPLAESDRDMLQYCHTCAAFKAPRSHHCRKCGKCVQKMDHHCPWINNCVGHQNHGFFVGFLFSAVFGCAHASWILSMSIYYGLHRSWYAHYGTGHEPKVVLTLFTLIVYIFALGMAIGVVLAVGALLFFQIRSIIRNQTGIEDWIMEKAAYRLRGTSETMRNPYDLGLSANIRQVLNLGCRPSCDGIEWPLRAGAHKFDLTHEQILQKRDKRLRTREYRILLSFSGSWCPLWSMGFRVACQPPCADEPRIPLNVGDVVHVTRWKKHWLYGDKIQASPANTRVRGWFPRKCAVEVVEGRQAESDFSSHEKQNKKKQR